MVMQTANEAVSLEPELCIHVIIERSAVFDSENCVELIRNLWR
jgi:hypothetical protein